MTGLVSLGSAVLDRIVGSETALERKVVGGAALNVAVGARRQGVPATLVAAVADDDAGAAIGALLTAEDVALVDAGSGRPTTIATAIRVGDTVEYAFSSETPSGLLTLDTHVAALVHGASVVVMSALRAGAGLGMLADALRASDALRVYDPNPRMRAGDNLAAHRREIEAIITACDLVKVAGEDLTLLYPDADPAELIRGILAGGARAVLVTHGPGGATLYADDVAVHVPSRISGADVVDPMGAGDAVTASLSASLYREGWPADRERWSAVLNRAMLAAAIVCGRLGASEAMPAAADLLRDGR